MLTFEEKQAVLDGFEELERRPVSLGRVNYHYGESAFDKKTVVYHLHPNGNGYVYAGRLDGWQTDDRGLVNIRDLSAEELRELVAASIRSLTAPSEETWIGEGGETLTVKPEDDLWYIYAGEQLDLACETYEEVKEYMAEEGFRLQDKE
ncbi:hypothetical protein J31TS4_27040 [Paenibacillus sp. J31TS4]|uniref:hypothetical protein n=1 Tax=Paenibacillus sp. J31TS4 TaxID=2807195 RepID=UPI001AFED27E|nr:hypothetical protein [Paenibacillus sp. J31TS4]GIP39424.1 hypothetical protein J31TS4_27040 [Paenibacillus sp. J31TS4]